MTDGKYMVIVDGAYIWHEFDHDDRARPLRGLLSRFLPTSEIGHILVIDGDSSRWHGHTAEINEQARTRSAWHDRLESEGVKLHLVSFTAKEGRSRANTADIAITLFTVLFASHGVRIALISGDGDLEPAVRHAMEKVGANNVLVGGVECSMSSSLRALGKEGVTVKIVPSTLGHRQSSSRA